MIHFCLPFLLKVMPLYLNMLLGYIAGKGIGTSRDAIAKLVLYIFVPLIIFNGVANTRLDLTIAFLPLLTLSMSILLSLVFYAIARKMWQDSTKNLVAFSAGTGNTGYFGLPLALLLFNDQGEGIYIMAALGFTIYENTLGFYLIARGKYSTKECLNKLVRLPALYALFIGLFFNLLHIPLFGIFYEFMKHIKGAYTVLGMMIIGLSLASLTKFKIDFRFIGVTFLAKFITWPLFVALVIFLDSYFFGVFDQNINQALILLSFVPLGVNMVILASLLDVQPEKASAAVLLSTLVAIVYIPLMVGCFIL